jgi:thioester reductase-like protein
MLERHRERFDLGASVLVSDRLIFVEGDSASPKLGLSESTYEEVSQLATFTCTTLIVISFGIQFL